MVGDVIRDCFAFLLLGLSVLVGFAVAFHVLFRHIVAGTEDSPSLPSNTTTDGNCTNSDLDDIQGSFGTFNRSLLTLFSALLGEFDLDVSAITISRSGIPILSFAGLSFHWKQAILADNVDLYYLYPHGDDHHAKLPHLAHGRYVRQSEG